jgi:hypothetical protein
LTPAAVGARLSQRAAAFVGAAAIVPDAQPPIVMFENLMAIPSTGEGSTQVLL